MSTELLRKYSDRMKFWLKTAEAFRSEDMRSLYSMTYSLQQQRDKWILAPL